MNGSHSLLTALSSLGILLLILCGAYLTSKWFAQKQQRLSISRHMEVLDSLSVGRERWFLLLKAGERIYLVGVTQQGMRTLGEFPASELGPENPPARGLEFGKIFKESLDRLMHRHGPDMDRTGDDHRDA